MAKFNRKRSKGQPEVSTAALPDIIFMLLFFFMVAAQVKDTEIKVKVAVPTADTASKLEKTSVVSHIHIGKPMERFQSIYGSAPRVQLNDQLVNDVEEVGNFIRSEKSKLTEEKKVQMIANLKIDKSVKMGIVSDVKIELRKAQQTKISYATDIAK